MHTSAGRWHGFLHSLVTVGIRRAGTAALLVATLVVASASGAVAAGEGRKPVVREPIREHVIEEVDPFALEVCGVEATREATVRGQFMLYGDGTSRTHLNIEIVYTDPETGDVLLIERDAETFFDGPVSETVDEEAGTVTLRFESTITGLPLRGIVPGEGILIRDAGRITENITIVLDLETGEELSFEAEVVDVRGPHPFLELSPEESAALFCGALTG